MDNMCCLCVLKMFDVTVIATCVLVVSLCVHSEEICDEFVCLCVCLHAQTLTG